MRCHCDNSLRSGTLDLNPIPLFSWGELIPFFRLNSIPSYHVLHGIAPVPAHYLSELQLFTKLLRFQILSLLIIVLRFSWFQWNQLHRYNFRCWPWCHGRWWCYCRVCWWYALDFKYQRVWSNPYWRSKEQLVCDGTGTEFSVHFQRTSMPRLSQDPVGSSGSVAVLVSRIGGHYWTRPHTSWMHGVDMHEADWYCIHWKLHCLCEPLVEILESLLHRWRPCYLTSHLNAILLLQNEGNPRCRPQ